MSCSVQFDYQRSPDARVETARVIPGIRHATSVVGRKKLPQSVSADLALRTACSDREELTTEDLFHRCLQAALPGPWIGPDGVVFIAQFCCDFLVLAGSYLGAGLVGPNSSLDSATQLGNLALFSVMFSLIGHAEGLYRLRDGQRTAVEIAIVCKAAGWSVLLLALTDWCMEMNLVQLSTTILSAVPAVAGMLAWRRCWRWRSSRNKDQGKGLRNVLIVGASGVGQRIATFLAKEGSGVLVKGFLDDCLPVGPSVLGGVRDLARVARAEFVDEVIVALPRQSDAVQDVLLTAQQNRLDVKLAPDLYGFGRASRVKLERIGDIPVLALHEEHLPGYGLLIKRVLDVILAGGALLLLAPLLACICVAVALDSPGPVLYRAHRVGRKGRKFLCYKFRTMVADADFQKSQLRSRNQRQGPFFKLANDPRITRIGILLRKYSLDELPQLWNVLRGDMSLVGPRPHPLDDVACYQLTHLRRLDVTPGITGLWQIEARQNPSFETSMALDLEYIERWSFWMDVRILFRTFSAVFEGGGV